MKFENGADMGNHQTKNMVIESVSALPTGIKGKVVLYTADNTLRYYNGSDWVNVTDAVLSNKAKGLIYLEPTITTTKELWTASSNDITSYYDGLMIAVKCPEATANTLYLKINSLTAHTIVVNATTAISTRYAADSVMLLCFKTVSGTSYWSVMDDAANTNTYVRQYQVTNNTNYSILTRYNTTDKTGSYDAAYAKYDLKAWLNHSTGIITSTERYLTTSGSYPLLYCSIAGVTSTANRELATPSMCNKAYIDPSTGKITAVSGAIQANETALVTGDAVNTALSGKQNSMTFTDVSITEVD